MLFFVSFHLICVDISLQPPPPSLLCKCTQTNVEVILSIGEAFGWQELKPFAYEWIKRGNILIIMRKSCAENKTKLTIVWKSRNETNVCNRLFTQHNTHFNGLYTLHRLLDSCFSIHKRFHAIVLQFLRNVNVRARACVCVCVCVVVRLFYCNFQM